MSDELLIQEIDAVTKESTLRPFNEEELISYSEVKSEALSSISSREQAKASALAKLSALGLTEEEIAAL